MKKIIPLLLIAKLSICFTYAQSAGIEGLSSFSAPSAASIPSVVNSPISPSTGIPDVSFPFFSLPTYGKNISVNAGMLYHPGSSGKYSAGTDLGLGWSLYGLSGSIYREVINNYPDPEDTGGDDIFYYSFLGRSGKFMFQNTTSGQPVIQKITLDKLDIGYTNTGGILKFKIIDEMGNSYFFDIADKSYLESSNKEFTNAYYLSKVTTASNLEVLNFEYLEDNYTITTSHYPYSKPIKSLKLKKINSPGYGSIQLTYTHDPVLRQSFNDPYQLQIVELKDNLNNIVNKYGFEQTFGGFSFPYYAYGSPDPCIHQWTQNKRILRKLLKYDRLNNTEATKFYYLDEYLESNWADSPCGCFENEESNPKYLGLGLLNKIVSPSGSEIRYEYELNKYYVNKNTTTYLTEEAPPYLIKDREAQYYEDLVTINFDTHNANLYMFSIPNDSPENYLYVCQNVDTYYDPCEDPLSPYDCSTEPFINIEFSSGTMTASGYKKFPPGFNSFEVKGTGGAGSVTIKRIKYKSLPVANYSVGNGVRIKSIDYYENNVLVEGLSKKYYYEKFNENFTSGVLSTIDDGNIVVYKNVKEITGSGNGYTKYYFKTLHDYPENLNTDGTLQYGNLKYYNILNNGLLEKVEVYNNANNLVSSESNAFEFQELTGNYSLFNGSSMKNAIVKKNTTTSTAYTSTGNIVQASEFTRDTKDFNIIQKKSTDSEGTQVEENIVYPWGVLLTQPKLWNAHIINVPLITEVKKNGKVIAKNEVKYDDATHYFPTSVVSTNPNDNSIKTTVRYDAYDTKGNVKQFTAIIDEATGQGIPTTVIWGYNETYPIAKIEGATINDVNSLVADIISKSNQDIDDASEKVLMQALDTFRSNSVLKNFRITTYTYNPLIGVTSTTSPNGMREVYKYDNSNRLQYVIDVNGNILKDYRYNTKPQP